MRFFVYASFAVVLTSCASPTVTAFNAPDGTSVKTVKCTSEASKCFVAASQSCVADGTYKVISSESHAGGIAADLIPGPVTWYAMTYACGPSDGKMPEFKWVGTTYTPASSVPAPQVVRPSPTTTNCTKIGDSVSCRTY
jgi:hypothetical protein